MNRLFEGINKALHCDEACVTQVFAVCKMPRSVYLRCVHFNVCKFDFKRKKNCEETGEFEMNNRLGYFP